jgi:hypothetical protein
MNPSLFVYDHLTLFFGQTEVAEPRYQYETISFVELITPLLPWLGAFAILGAIAYAVYRVLEIPKVKAYLQGWRLFHALCRAHQLERKGVRCLKQLIAAAGLEHPALVFVRPDLFQQEKLPVSLRQQSERYAQLRARLFEPRETLG